MADNWYLRYPDGREVRAPDTNAVRKRLASGRIPAGTHLRRSRREEWRSIEVFAEFADLARNGSGNGASRRANTGPARSTIASRLDPLEFDRRDVRGVLEELLAALASASARGKVGVALLAGAAAGGLAGLMSLPFFSFELLPPGPGFLLVLGMLLVAVWLTSVLAQLTFHEVSRLRSAPLADGLKGSPGFMCRLFVLQGGALLVLGGLVLAARWLPGALLDSAAGPEDPGWRIAAGAAAWLGVLVEAGVWLVALLLLPLGPLLIVEDCSAFRALVGWLGLLRQHFAALLLGESMALVAGLVLSLPAALAVLALFTFAPDPRLALPAGVARSVVAGMAGGLFFGYLIVANVFVYLHLKYEATGER